MLKCEFHNLTEKQLQKFANKLGKIAVGTEILLLSGDLGAGKTVFAKALASGYGVTGPVTSPTFTIMNVYNTSKGEFAHLDLYRIEDEAEVAYLGIEEYFDQALMAIEWPERLPELPNHYLQVYIEQQDFQVRNLLCNAQGNLEEILLEGMKKFADSGA